MEGLGRCESCNLFNDFVLCGPVLGEHAQGSGSWAVVLTRELAGCGVRVCVCASG